MQKVKLFALITALAVSLSVSQVAKATELDSVESDFETALQTAPLSVSDTLSSDPGHASLNTGVVTAPTSEGGEISFTLPDENISSFGLDDYSTSAEGVSIAVTDEGGGSFRSLLHIPSNNGTNVITELMSSSFLFHRMYLSSTWKMEGLLSVTTRGIF